MMPVLITVSCTTEPITLKSSNPEPVLRVVCTPGRCAVHLSTRGTKICRWSRVGGPGGITSRFQVGARDSIAREGRVTSLDRPQRLRAPDLGTRRGPVLRTNSAIEALLPMPGSPHPQGPISKAHALAADFHSHSSHHR